MLVKFGGVAVDGRGSIAGNTFSRNRYGNYVRARTTPVNPQSSRQVDSRNDMAYVSQLWRSDASQANRDAWNQYASNVEATNKLSEVINLSGYNQFCKSNKVAKNAGLAEILAAPTIYTAPGTDPTFAATVDAGTGKITITFDDTREWVDEDDAAMIIEMGLPQDDSINFFNGPWRYAGALLGDSVTPLTSPDATVDVPFQVADGQKVWVRAKIIRADGRISASFRDDTVVATA